ncbi:MAG: cytochrome c maturation protein CcmE [Acidobacteriota bacterium]|nr:cytochrome c maturation protein CcmE [Acidobacteriota bacterium]
MTSTEAPLDLAPVAPPPARRHRRRRVVAVLVVLAACLAVLLSQGLLRSLNYFETVDQALAHRHALGTRVIRLEGVVEAGTITRTADGAAFVIAGSGAHRVAVDSRGTPPQLFGADIPVVVVGHFASDTSDLFLGSQVLVKHTSTYIAQHPGRVRAPNGSTR